MHPSRGFVLQSRLGSRHLAAGNQRKRSRFGQARSHLSDLRTTRPYFSLALRCDRWRSACVARSRYKGAAPGPKTCELVGSVSLKASKFTDMSTKIVTRFRDRPFNAAQPNQKQSKTSHTNPEARLGTPKRSIITPNATLYKDLPQMRDKYVGGAPCWHVKSREP